MPHLLISPFAQTPLVHSVIWLSGDPAELAKCPTGLFPHALDWLAWRLHVGQKIEAFYRLFYRLPGCTAAKFFKSHPHSSFEIAGRYSTLNTLFNISGPVSPRCPERSNA